MTDTDTTTTGAVPEHTEDEKDLKWEALRERAATIGARAALDEAVRALETRHRGHVLFDYLWFLLVCSCLLLAVARVGGCDDRRDHGSGSHIPAEVKGGSDVR